MHERHGEGFAAIAQAVLETAGDLDPGVRRAIESRAAVLGGREAEASSQVPEALAPYVDKVALHAYKVTDADVQRLKEAGYSEDAIFEATLAAALGAAAARREQALASVLGRRPT